MRTPTQCPYLLAFYTRYCSKPPSSATQNLHAWKFSKLVEVDDFPLEYSRFKTFHLWWA